MLTRRRARNGVMWKWCGNTGLRRLAKTPGLDRLSSSSAYINLRFYFDAYAFWKITAVFLGTRGQLTHTRRTDGVPEPDGALRTVERAKIRHYRQLYINRPEPIAFMPVAVDTAGRIYEDFSRLLFLTATVKPRLWLMRYQRNQNNLDFFAQLALLILRGQWGWFWLSHRTYGSLYRLTCHLGLLYHFRVSFVLDVSHHS
jgi:hypothetical protein